MKIQRLTLTIFFTLLTLSIGLASTHSTASTVNAQNNALSQYGNSNAEQKIEQGQANEQNAQCLSRETSEESCNNVSCSVNSNSDLSSFNPELFEACLPQPEPETDILPVSKTLTCKSVPGLPDNEAVCNYAQTLASYHERSPYPIPTPIYGIETLYIVKLW